MIFSTLTDAQLLRYFRDNPVNTGEPLEELLSRFAEVTNRYNEITEVLDDFNLPYEDWNEKDDLFNAIEALDNRSIALDGAETILIEIINVLEDKEETQLDKVKYVIDRLGEIV